MARKVFISVLGTGYYSPVKYQFDDEIIETRFIQEASVKHFCKSWTEHDRIYIFLTEKAREYNWNTPAQQNDPHKRDNYDGLKELLSRIETKAKITDDISIDIKDGNTENEIWENFQIIFDTLNDGDELYFDITHAFRTIPMMVMVLINYAKFLRNIKLESITYGNFEARNEEGIAPVTDITSFSVLQDWTNAANEFINNGKFDSLITVLGSTISPLLREDWRKYPQASSLDKLNKPLKSFSDNLQTCRAIAIEQGDDAKKIQDLLNKNKDSYIKPLNPILNKIDNKIQPFLRNGTFNKSMAAVSWCIKHELYQQAITLLQEAVVTLICDELKINRIHEPNRNIVNSSFTIFMKDLKETEWTGDAKENADLTRKVMNESITFRLIEKEYSKLSALRNDINHAGWRAQRSKPAKFQDVKELFCSIISKLPVDAPKPL